MTCRQRFLIPVIVASLALMPCAQAGPDTEHELLLFLSGGPTYHQILPDDGLERYDWFFDADVFYSFVHDRFRLIGEYIASTDEAELERLQVGWQGEGENIGWLGRFHAPGRYWNIAYHHGQYLQTSITRPLIEQFEDEGGILATHLTGALLQTGYPLQGGSDLRASFSFGAAPVIDRTQLRPYDLLGPDSDSRGAAELRLAWLPDALGEDQAGVVMGWYDLAVDGSSTAQQQQLRRVEQYVITAFLDWRWQDTRIVSSVAQVMAQLKGEDRNWSDSFLSGYVQAEYTVREDWTLFGRLEDTTETDSSDYLTLFPNAVTDRLMLGLRFDVTRNQALTLEMSRAETRIDDFEQVLLQWSAVLP